MIGSIGKKLGRGKKEDARALWHEKNQALIALLKENRAPEARDLAQEILELAEGRLSRSAPETATSYCNMGMLLLLDKDYELAEECFREALALRKKIFGPSHKEVAVIYMNLIELYKQMAQAILYGSVESTTVDKGST